MYGTMSGQDHILILYIPYISIAEVSCSPDIFQGRKPSFFTPQHVSLTNHRKHVLICSFDAFYAFPEGHQGVRPESIIKVNNERAVNLLGSGRSKSDL